MENEISENFLLYDTAQEIWNAAKETFSTSDNTAELFAVESILHDLRQGDDSVTSYFTKLSRLWQQVDTFETDKFENPRDESTHKKSIEKRRIFKFLLGLNRNLDDVRGRVMAIKPLPTLREAFSEVVREESRRKVMLGTDSENIQTEGSALSVYGSQTGNRQKRGGRPWCDHCKKPGHVRDTCWKIHGKPSDWKPKSDHEGKGNTAVSSEPSSKAELFSKDQLDFLKQIINQQTPPPIATGSVAQTGLGFGEDDWQC